MTYEQYEHQQEQWAREWWARNGAVVMDLARLLEEARDIYVTCKPELPVAFLNALDEALTYIPDPPEY